MKLDEPGHRLDSDGVKLYCSTMGKNVADRAIQVLGGYGYCGEYHVERLLREVMIARIAPVSPQLILCNIAEKVLGMPKSY